MRAVPLVARDESISGAQDVPLVTQPSAWACAEANTKRTVIIRRVRKILKRAGVFMMYCLPMMVDQLLRCTSFIGLCIPDLQSKSMEDWNDDGERLNTELEADGIGDGISVALHDDLALGFDHDSGEGFGARVADDDAT